MTAQPYGQTSTVPWSVMDDQPRLQACMDRLNERVAERYRAAGQWLVKAAREDTVEAAWLVDMGEGEGESMLVGAGMARVCGIDTDTATPNAALLRVVWWPR